jgi:type II secretory pathway component PulF
MEFSYKAKDDSGRTVTGVLEADTEDALAELLDQQNLFLIEAASVKSQNRRKSRQRISSRDIINFTNDMSTILAAGIPLAQGLRDLASGEEHSRLRAVIDDLTASIETGSSLSAAFERHPRYFDQLYVSIVRAGETSGNLDRVLSDLSEFLEWKADLRRDVVQALIYPSMVLAVVVGLIIILSTFVFPQFAAVLTQSRGPLPLPTRILFFTSNLFINYWWLLILAIAAAITAFWMWVRTEKGRAWFDGFKLKVPVFGQLTRKIALSRFCHFFQILFSAGVDLSQSLTILEDVIGNTVLAEATRVVRQEVRAGQSLAASLEATGQFPRMIIRVFYIGETSGQLVSALEKACRYYDKEIPATIKKVFSILEPMLYVFLAIVVLTVALAIYLPLYQMIGSISGR